MVLLHVSVAPDVAQNFLIEIFAFYSFLMKLSEVIQKT